MTTHKPATPLRWKAAIALDASLDDATNKPKGEAMPSSTPRELRELAAELAEQASLCAMDPHWIARRKTW